MRTTRKVILVVLAAALLAAVPFFPVRAATPQRSGTILSGTGWSPANVWVRGMEGCLGAPTCSAWMQSGCSTALAGTNPAVHAAIVDVAALADNRTERVLTVEGGVGINWGYYIVQFWTKAEGSLDCGEILASRLDSWACGGTYSRRRCAFRVPAGARWMTITSSPDNTNIRWKLS
jgi:hypothetical protein